ncbi:LysR family transcriptional regulator [Chimaeribacter californicus]|uniref:LysR family transcriptional regulator n=1 Tax=Chimaeribacter californicus TaxID=2060067 RepID=A0A2N5DWE0_9GAMM|nr:LysR family transcriptional regulator [Chimaeribacter californicus]PLR31498.1 LysR family transcriptional regulator [Chimaeribacter californicus]
MRIDLNDYRYFAEVVAHGGFAAAGRALHEPKSKLSRRIANLEARLGVRLIERTSRRFRVTEVGQSFYLRCRAMLLEAEQAEAVVAETQAEPHGLVRFSCPTGMVEVVSPLITAFLHRYPKVRLQLIAIDRAVDLIEERIDVALRIRIALTSDAELIMRSLGESRRILVAGRQWATQRGQAITALADLPTLATQDEPGDVVWELESMAGDTHTVRHVPRMTCSDFAAVRAAAIQGLGVAFLPDHSCREALAQGELIRLWPEWHSQAGRVHLVFTTRRGLPPAVRAFIDCLAGGFPAEALSDKAGLNLKKRE